MLYKLLHGLWCAVLILLLLLFLLLSLVVIVAFAKHCISRHHYTTILLLRRSESWRIPTISLLLLNLSCHRIGFIIAHAYLSLWRHIIINTWLLLICTVSSWLDIWLLLVCRDGVRLDVVRGCRFLLFELYRLLRVGFAQVIDAQRVNIHSILAKPHEFFSMQDGLETETLLLERDDELLGMAPALGWCARENSTRHSLPITAILLQGE